MKTFMNVLLAVAIAFFLVACVQWAIAAVVKPIPLNTLSLGDLVEKANDGDKQAHTFLMGLWGGISWTNMYVDIVQHQKSVYCPPKGKVFDDKVVMGIMTTGLDDCKECKEEQAALGIISLMLKEFPCDDGENVDGYESEDMPPAPVKKGG